MGTRSTIIMFDNELGKYKGIYCHWDGYPDHNGRILIDYYNTYDKVKELIELGSLSSLNARIKPIGEHSFDKPEKGTTVAHERDRGVGEGIPAKIGKSPKTIVKSFDSDYTYVFKDDKWKCWESSAKFTKKNEIDLFAIMSKEDVAIDA